MADGEDQSNDYTTSVHLSYGGFFNKSQPDAPFLAAGLTQTWHDGVNNLAINVRGLERTQTSPLTQYAHTQRGVAFADARAEFLADAQGGRLSPENPQQARDLINRRLRDNGFAEFPPELLAEMLVDENYITSDEDGARIYDVGGLFGAIRGAALGSPGLQFQTGPVTVNFANPQADGLNFASGQLSGGYRHQLSHYTASFPDDLREYFETMIENGELVISDGDQERFLEIIRDNAHYIDHVEQGYDRDALQFQQLVFRDLRQEGIALTFQALSNPPRTHLTTRSTTRPEEVAAGVASLGPNAGTPGLRSSNATRTLSVSEQQEGEAMDQDMLRFFNQWVEDIRTEANAAAQLAGTIDAQEHARFLTDMEAQNYADSAAREAIRQHNQQALAENGDDAALIQVAENSNFSGEYLDFHARFLAEFRDTRDEEIFNGHLENLRDDFVAQNTGQAYDHALTRAMHDLYMGDRPDIYLDDIKGALRDGLMNGNLTGEQAFHAILSRTGIVEIHAQGRVVVAPDVVSGQMQRLNERHANLEEEERTSLLIPYTEQLQSIHHRMSQAGLEVEAPAAPEAQSAAPAPNASDDPAPAPGT